MTITIAHKCDGCGALVLNAAEADGWVSRDRPKEPAVSDDPVLVTRHHCPECVERLPGL